MQNRQFDPSSDLKRTIRRIVRRHRAEMRVNTAGSSLSSALTGGRGFSPSTERRRPQQWDLFHQHRRDSESRGEREALKGSHILLVLAALWGVNSLRLTSPGAAACIDLPSSGAGVRSALPEELRALFGKQLTRWHSAWRSKRSTTTAKSYIAANSFFFLSSQSN